MHRAREDVHRQARGDMQDERVQGGVAWFHAPRRAHGSVQATGGLQPAASREQRTTRPGLPLPSMHHFACRSPIFPRLWSINWSGWTVELHRLPPTLSLSRRPTRLPVLQHCSRPLGGGSTRVIGRIRLARRHKHLQKTCLTAGRGWAIAAHTPSTSTNSRARHQSSRSSERRSAST